MSLDKGLICKLTHRNPNFKNTCAFIKKDKKFLKKLEMTNLNLEIIQRNKNTTHLSFYLLIFIGFSLIFTGLTFSEWSIQSRFLWGVKIGIIGAGITFLVTAYAKLNTFRKKFKKAKLDKIMIDDSLKKYNIEYYPYFDFKEKIHGIQEVIVTLKFKNWKKEQTQTSYKIDS
ncbi:hypothetical protein SCB49_08553 [unidentified eubacterium SCB49]|nr:hypothetical protein SCB49_08553 [unidentified eubacterium SCB49]